MYSVAVSPVAPSDKLKLLANVELFSGFSAKQLEAASRVARTKSLERRQELFHKGDEGGEVYVVASGKLKALTTSMDGDDVVFSILGPGEVFGEVALLGATPRTATVTAIEDCWLLVIDRRDFMSFLRTNPEVSVKLLSVLAMRLKRVSELVEDTLFLNLAAEARQETVVDEPHLWGEGSRGDSDRFETIPGRVGRSGRNDAREHQQAGAQMDRRRDRSGR